MNNRQNEILKIVSDVKKIEVNELSTRLNVSGMTIRKDLMILEKKGLLTREHGFAIANNEDDINTRLAFNYEEKIKLAKKAASLVKPNETILVESGSTCALFALEVAKMQQFNTIVTNSCFIARYLKDYPSTTVLVLGGKYQSKSETIVGSSMNTLLSTFYFDQFFFGCDGIDEHGFSGCDFERAEAVRLMAAHANKKIVLTESSKCDKRSSFPLFQHKEINTIVTDEHLNSDYIDLFKTSSITIL